MRRQYSEETKAAVMAALLAGQSVTDVARQYKIPEGTIKAWNARMERPNDVPSERRAELGDLLLEYLYINLETLKAQSIAFRDPAWIRKQGASELAVMHGVLMDKTIRLLEAMSTSDAGGAD